MGGYAGERERRRRVGMRAARDSTFDEAACPRSSVGRERYRSHSTPCTSRGIDFFDSGNVIFKRQPRHALGRRRDGTAASAALCKQHDQRRRSLETLVAAAMMQSLLKRETSTTFSPSTFYSFIFSFTCLLNLQVAHHCFTTSPLLLHSRN